MLELREENVAAAPGPPWGEGEGQIKYPWSDLLTRRMLAQARSWGNVQRRKSRDRQRSSVS